MNEGHAAFCGLERIREMIERDRLRLRHRPRGGARRARSSPRTRPSRPATTCSAPQLIEHYFAAYLPGLKIDRHEFLALGKQNPADPNEPFGMTVLALRLSNIANGVSDLHGSVSRKMWKAIWPDLPDSEVPITSITNGVHTLSWVSPDMAQLYDRYLGSAWRGGLDETEVWKRVDTIPDAELWRTHERRRERLVAFARDRLKKQLIARRRRPPRSPAPRRSSIPTR